MKMEIKKEAEVTHFETPECKVSQNVTIDEVQAMRDRLQESEYFNRDYRAQIARRDWRIAALEEKLAQFQESEFHPDWSMLEATRGSLREAGAMIKELQAENERLKRQIAALPEYCPVCHNAAHQPCEAGTEGAVLDDGGEWIVCEVCYWKREALRLKQDAARWRFVRDTYDYAVIVSNKNWAPIKGGADSVYLEDEAIDAVMKDKEDE